jgi:predicted phosphodiesterase
MGKRSFKIMGQPDTHFPFHDEAALACFKRAVQEEQPDILIVLGDMLDAVIFSSFDAKTFSEAKAKDFKKSEIDPANKHLDFLQKHSKKVIYIEGNHEARVERVAVKLGQLGAGIYSLISPKVLLSNGRKNFEWVDYNVDFKKAHYKITPRLLALHGLSTAKHAPAKHLEKLKSYSVIYGHTHRRQSDTRRDPIQDLVHEAMSPGCLSTLTPKYMHGNPNEWVHGFLLGYCRFDGSKHTLYNIGIEHGEAVLPSGKLVKG